MGAGIGSRKWNVVFGAVVVVVVVVVVVAVELISTGPMPQFDSPVSSI